MCDHRGRTALDDFRRLLREVMPVSTQSPFLDVRSYAQEETSADAAEPQAARQVGSPFLGMYRLDAEGGADPQAEAFVSFLNELYDDQFNDALTGLVNEASAIYQANFGTDQNDPRTVGYQAERLLTQHFAPLVGEAETLIGTLATELANRDPAMLSEDEVDTLVDGHLRATDMNPQFEEWLGGLLKKVVNTGVSLATSAASTIAKLGLGPILNKLLALVKPLIRRVVESAIDRLPINLQPIARTLRDKLPFLRESEALEGETTGADEIAGIQQEFNYQVANLLFAPTETEQDLEVARATDPPATPEVYPLAEFDAARQRFVDDLGRLKDGEDPRPLVENFIPALLPVLKIGMKLAGRPRVVGFLAQFLSKAIVDAGLRLLQLETPAEGETAVAGSAVAATVEEAVRRVAALPDYVLDNQELLEGATLEAFEQAAAANLPPVLPAAAYRERPDLTEHCPGFWYRGGRRYKRRVGRPIVARISPYRAAGLETFDGATVGEALEEQYALAPGEETDAQVHLYEAMPGMRLADIVNGEDVIPKAVGEQTVLHPLTRDAATLLLGQPEMGRDPEPGETPDPTAPQAGDRFYHLEIPGRRPLTVPAAPGVHHVRHRTRIRFLFHFPKNKIVVHLYLSEIRAQELAVKLRQNAHLGVVMQRLRRIVSGGMDRAFAGSRGSLRIVHGSVVPGNPASAFGRLPSLVPQVLRGRVTEWVVKGLADHLARQAQNVIRAAEDPADGVTLVLTLADPPGFREIGEALKGGGMAPATLKLPDGEPTITLKAYPGRRRG
jgi:hypothetical protein